MFFKRSVSVVFLTALCFICTIDIKADQPAESSKTTTRMGQSAFDKFLEKVHSKKCDISSMNLDFRACKEEFKKYKNLFPRQSHIDTIERIAAGILKVTRVGWYFCGKRLSKEEATVTAYKWAYTIVYSCWLEYVDPPDETRVFAYQHVETRPIKINPWAVAGLIYNESAFDICALGVYPRKAAYQLGLLKQKRKSISHTPKEISRVVASKKLQELFKRSGFDLGALQELSKYYPNIKVSDLLTWEGVRMQIHSLANRGRKLSTDRPWRFWPGYESEKKDKNVVYHARKLGATKKDIYLP